MTIFSVLSLLCRLFGLFRMADAFWERHESKIKAREIANAPTTRPELEKTLEEGKL